MSTLDRITTAIARNNLPALRKLITHENANPPPRRNSLKFGRLAVRNEKGHGVPAT
jgi:hypothetical protein